MRLLSLLMLAPLAIACGPSKVAIAPADVTRIDLRPASGQGLFCPGDAFQVEMIARLKDGTACSSSDRKLGCKGTRDAVIDPTVVRLQAWPGEPVKGHDFTWRSDPDPLRTAATGLLLRGWIEKDGNKSVEGQNTLKPTYACQSEHVLGYHEHLDYGAPGGTGPVVHVFVTTLSTPFYANAALVRIESPELNISQYAISPSADKPVRIVAKGQDGARGFPGAPGHPGSRGADASSSCGVGGRGGDGGPGGYGGPGGEGGPGGIVHVHLDAAAADALAHRVQVLTPGGHGGDGGYGGSGGPGGAGGSAGPSGKNCFGKSGDAGMQGSHGPPGPPGASGPHGPPPTFVLSPRNTMFGKELSLIQQIEATPAPK
jgi:hypothetical protein